MNHLSPIDHLLTSRHLSLVSPSCAKQPKIHSAPGRGLRWTAAGLLSLSLSASAFAQSSSSWINPAGGLWDTPANWSQGVVADGAGNFADFGPLVDITGDTVVNLNSPRTIGSLSFTDSDPSSAGGWVLGNSGVAANVLTLDNGKAILVDLLGTGKAVTINANIVAAADITPTVDSVGVAKQGSGALVLTGTNNLNNQQLRVIGSGSLTLTGATTGVSRLFVRDTSSLILEGNALLTTGETNQYLSIGLEGADNATAIMRGNSVWNHVGTDFNISDVGASQGSLTLSDSASLTSKGAIFVSKNNGTVGTLTVGGNSTVVGNANLVVGQGEGANGTLVQSGGTITVAGETWIGNNAAGNGTFTKTGGAMTGNNWFVVGRFGAKGVLNMSGGSLTKSGNGHLIIADGGGSVGEMTVSGTAAVTVNNELWVGQGGNSNGTLTVQAGTVATNSWVAIGREGGKGTLNVEGGTITKAENGNTAFIIGAGGGSTGTLNQTGGTIAVTAGDTWIGEGGTGVWNISAGNLTSTNLSIGRNGAGNGTFNLSGTGTVQADEVNLGELNTAQGTLNLNGGTLRTNFLEVGTGTAQLNFNGSLLQARQDEGDFLRGFNAANSEIQAGGLIFDSATFNVAIQTELDGAGGLTKRGDGSLTLTEASTYTGETKVEEGILFLTGADASLASDVTVFDEAAFGGNGTVTGTVLLQSGARLAADSSNGPLTLQAGLGLSSTGGNVLEFGLGADADLIAILGGTFLGNSSGVTTISLLEGVDFAPGLYTLIDWTDATATGVDLSDFQLAPLPENWTASLKLGPDSKSIQAEVVPEPSAAMLLGIAGAGLLGLRRRRAVK